MIFDYSLAALVTAGPARLPHLRTAQARTVLKGHDHDRHRLGPDSSLLRDHRRNHAAARRLHDARVQRRTHVPFADPAAGRSRDLEIAGVDERQEQHAVTYTVGMLLFHVGGFLILYALMRLQAGLPFNPAGQSAVAPKNCRSIRR